MLDGGYHLIIDLEGCDARKLNSKQAMLDVCRKVAAILGARVIQSGGHQFAPRGVTAFVVIAESHISAHTWPEAGKAFLDVFTCKETIDADRILDFVRGALGAKRGRVTFLLRDSLLSRVLFSSEVPVATLELDFGRTIFSTRSPFQRIELTKGPMGLSLFLDGYWQFVEQYEDVYHEVLIHPAMACAPRLHRIGIGGGGDGLAIREVLKYPNVGSVWLYEIDPQMIDLARRHPELVRLNRGSLDHPKARVVAADARRMLSPTRAFDVLIFDFPSISDGRKFEPLYSVSLYRSARRALAPDGILVTQVTDFSWHLERTVRHLRRVFPMVYPMQVDLGNSVFNFVAASTQPLRQRRALPAGLRFLRQDVLDPLLGRRIRTRARRSAPARAAS